MFPPRGQQFEKLQKKKVNIYLLRDSETHNPTIEFYQNLPSKFPFLPNK